ncbi:MAG: peptidase and matrixin and adamalysin [Gemmatimonadetes bacterium]|nr:peptidase and matrixin and adamalysin [Gemmatimonadota bacterium]
MPNRKSLPFAGRAFTLLAAAVVASGIVDCATYPSGAHDGTLSTTLSTPSARTPAAVTHARRSVGELLAVGANTTYIGRLLAERDSTIERWPDFNGRPLRVWIDSSSTIGGAQATFPAAIRAAFAEWAGTGIPLRFAYVTSARDADVRVRWTDHLDRKTGSTTWRTDRQGWLVSGDITLATHISDGHALDGRGMRAIALHEVGHSLGLSHSTDPHDIMASLVRVDGLSAPDRETIRLLYSLPAGRVPTGQGF